MDQLASHPPMVVLRLFDFASGWLFAGDAAFQAAITTAAQTGQHLDFSQGCDAMDAASIAGLGAFEAAIGIGQHGLERFAVKAAQGAT
jgi:hypothetical protein